MKTYIKHFYETNSSSSHVLFMRKEIDFNFDFKRLRDESIIIDLNDYVENIVPEYEVCASTLYDVFAKWADFIFYCCTRYKNNDLEIVKNMLEYHIFLKEITEFNSLECDFDKDRYDLLDEEDIMKLMKRIDKDIESQNINVTESVLERVTGAEIQRDNWMFFTKFIFDNSCFVESTNDWMNVLDEEAEAIGAQVRQNNNSSFILNKKLKRNKKDNTETTPYYVKYKLESYCLEKKLPLIKNIQDKGILEQLVKDMKDNNISLYEQCSNNKETIYSLLKYTNYYDELKNYALLQHGIILPDNSHIKENNRINIIEEDWSIPEDEKLIKVFFDEILFNTRTIHYIIGNDYKKVVSHPFKIIAQYEGYFVRK